MVMVVLIVEVLQFVVVNMRVREVGLLIASGSDGEGGFGRGCALRRGRGGE